MLRIVSLFVVASAVVDCNSAAPTASEDRERFLAEYANLPGFGYLKRIALKADRKKTIQRKKTSMQDPPELRKRVQELSKYNVNPADQSGSILRENEPLADFLYQGDLVLPAPLAEAVNMTKSLKQHRAGGFNDVVNGVKIEFQKWPHDSPICFRFKEGSDPNTMDIARKAFQFWTENSCLRWEEGCVGKPTIVISTDGRGCNTSPGRLFTSFGFRKRADGTADVVPDFADEQPMSLKAPGCSYFGTAAHEASHAMGMVHEQARLDRDNYIDIVKDNIANGWLQQYDKQQGSETYGIVYDYASNMQYTGYANDPKIDMAAKEKIYQHTMGSRYGPIFNDLKFLNTYNDCMCKGGIVCANQGFPHPRHCDTKCVCPEGFGGATCAERQAGENGAPVDCGATLTATTEWQSAVVSVPKPAIPATKPQVALRQACCTWWIKGNGKRVELQLESVTPAQAYGCRNDCAWGGTEVKFGDLTRGGARVCCAEHAKEFGTVSTSTDMAIVRVCSMRSAYTTTVKFRTTG